MKCIKKYFYCFIVLPLFITTLSGCGNNVLKKPSDKVVLNDFYNLNLKSEERGFITDRDQDIKKVTDDLQNENGLWDTPIGRDFELLVNPDTMRNNLIKNIQSTNTSLFKPSVSSIIADKDTKTIKIQITYKILVFNNDIFTIKDSKVWLNYKQYQEEWIFTSASDQ